MIDCLLDCLVLLVTNQLLNTNNSWLHRYRLMTLIDTNDALLDSSSGWGVIRSFRIESVFLFLFFSLQETGAEVPKVLEEG